MYLRAVPFLVLLSLAGCATVDYYAQTVSGHFQLMGRSRSIAELVADPETPAELKERLQLVTAIRDYASSQLFLPENESYRNYADLQREAVVWSLVATDEFSIQPRQWCYPVIGCAVYRGYFSSTDAQKQAVLLREQGRDVAVEPIPAYSTLGWFDDPLPSTVIHWSEAQLAGLIFHELAHQQLYVPDDSPFNEAFATTVERVGVERWFRQRGDLEGERAWRDMERREREFVALILDTRQRLQRLYGQPLTAAEMRAGKTAEFERLRAQYFQRRASWGNNPGLDRWFGRELNNAHLALIATYEQWVPAFQELLRREQGDMRRFFQASKKLAQLGRKERETALRQLLQAAASSPVRTDGADRKSASSRSVP
jgi:predicted aminopeptidase